MVGNEDLKNQTPRSRGRTTRCEQRVREGSRQVLAAWERFAAGGDDIRGVPQPVLRSWYRCRDVYRVDPQLPGAPRATLGRHSSATPHDTVFAQLGGIAAATVAGNDDCLATVTDGNGRILASWGNGPSMRKATDNSLAPLFAWSEPAVGTNGMGTALSQRGPVSVRGPEHWCAALHAWDCIGIAILDPVTRSPVAALNVSSWRHGAPVTSHILVEQTRAVRKGLQYQALRDADDITQAFLRADRHSRCALVALDLAGSVIASNHRARQLFGDLPQCILRDPAQRWRAETTILREIARKATTWSYIEPEWSGSVDLGAVFGGPAEMFNLVPLWSSDCVVGLLLISSEQCSDEVVAAEDGVDARRAAHVPARVPAVRDGRLLLLLPEEIRYAEAARHDVWLVTDRGRIRANTHGIEQAERELEPLGFMRVHRSYLVNLGRICEVSNQRKGVMTLSTLPHMQERIPVSRRCSVELRQTLGL